MTAKKTFILTFSTKKKNYEIKETARDKKNERSKLCKKTARIHLEKM